MELPCLSLREILRKKFHGNSDSLVAPQEQPVRMWTRKGQFQDKNQSAQLKRQLKYLEITSGGGEKLVLINK